MPPKKKQRIESADMPITFDSLPLEAQQLILSRCNSSTLFAVAGTDKKRRNMVHQAIFEGNDIEKQINLIQSHLLYLSSTPMDLSNIKHLKKPLDKRLRVLTLALEAKTMLAHQPFDTKHFHAILARILLHSACENGVTEYAVSSIFALLPTNERQLYLKYLLSSTSGFLLFWVSQLLPVITDHDFTAMLRNEVSCDEIHINFAALNPVRLQQLRDKAENEGFRLETTKTHQREQHYNPWELEEHNVSQENSDTLLQRLPQATRLEKIEIIQRLCELLPTIHNRTQEDKVLRELNSWLNNNAQYCRRAYDYRDSDADRRYFESCDELWENIMDNVSKYFKPLKVDANRCELVDELISICIPFMYAYDHSEQKDVCDDTILWYHIRNLSACYPHLSQSMKEQVHTVLIDALNLKKTHDYDLDGFGVSETLLKNESFGKCFLETIFYALQDIEPLLDDDFMLQVMATEIRSPFKNFCNLLSIFNIHQVKPDTPGEEAEAPSP
jgi:hypothetical protein